MVNAKRWLRVGLFVSFGVLISVFGSSLKNTYQVYFSEIATAFRIDRGDFALSGSLFVLIIGFASPVVGYVADRIGARATLLCGVLLAGLVFLGTAVTGHYVSFLAIYGVGAALAYTSLTYVPLGVLAEEIGSRRWRGVIYSLMANGSAIGFIVLSPLWIFLGTMTDWRTVYLWVGGVFLVPLALLCLAMLRLTPADDPGGTEGSRRERKALGRNLKIIGTSPQFYVLAGTFAGCGFTMALIDIHVMPFFEELGLAPHWRALAISVLGATELAFGLAAGFLCDRGDKKRVLAGCYALRAVAIGCLVVSPTVVGALVFAVLFGASYMGTVLATTGLFMEGFNSDVRGLALGCAWLFHQLGALVCTQAGAELYDSFHTYQAIFILGSGVAFAAALGSLLVGRGAMLTFRLAPDARGS